MLTLQQSMAILNYTILRNKYPKQLFSERSSRRIVVDEERLAEFAERTGQIVGLVAQNEYILYVIDLVESDVPSDDVPSDGSNVSLQEYLYMRIISRRQLMGGTNVVVIGTIANPSLGTVGAVVLVEQERHATGLRHLELPRGFAESDLSGEENALKELRDETGFIGMEAIPIGETYTDTGTTDARVTFYHVPVVDYTEPKPETREAIKKVDIVSKEDIWQRIRLGSVKDSFTLQALTLLERSSQGR
jgi:ADP-ribose pyrophosphatase